MERLSVVRKGRRTLACGHIGTLSPEGPGRLSLKYDPQDPPADWRLPGPGTHVASRFARCARQAREALGSRRPSFSVVATGSRFPRFPLGGTDKAFFFYNEGLHECHVTRSRNQLLLDWLLTQSPPQGEAFSKVSRVSGHRGLRATGVSDSAPFYQEVCTQTGP